MNQSIKYYYFLFLIAIVCGILTLGMISVLAMIIGYPPRLLFIPDAYIAAIFVLNFLIIAPIVAAKLDKKPSSKHISQRIGDRK